MRVLYYWAPDDDRIYMIYIYSKSEQGDLTQAQIKALGRLVRRELK